LTVFADVSVAILKSFGENKKFEEVLDLTEMENSNENMQKFREKMIEAPGVEKGGFNMFGPSVPQPIAFYTVLFTMHMKPGSPESIKFHSSLKRHAGF
jgi:hypothetical protein